MKTIEQIFKEKYSHTFDVTPSFEGAFLECAKAVSEEYSKGLKAENKKLREALNDILHPKLSMDSNEASEQWHAILLNAEQVLKED